MKINLDQLKQIFDGVSQMLDISGKLFLAFGALYFFLHWRADDGKGMQNGIFMILGGVGVIAIAAYIKGLIP